MTTRSRKNISSTETALRQIIFEELIRNELREGLWDNSKAGVKKISAALTKQFKGVAEKWAKAITQKLSKMTEIPEDVKKLVGVLKTAMKDSGESIKLDSTLKAAKKLGELGSTGVLEIVEEDLRTSVKEKAKALSESTDILGALAIMNDSRYISHSDATLLKEDFGITTALGLSLALLGGLPMLFKGLHNLAEKMGAEKTAHLFEQIEHILHGFETSVIEGVIPFRLAYHVYLGLWKLGIKLTATKEPLNEIEIKAEKIGQKAISKAQHLIYKAMLVYFAFAGIQGALKAGVSLMGFIEGAATTVKGVELANGIESAMTIIATATASAKTGA